MPFLTCLYAHRFHEILQTIKKSSFQKKFSCPSSALGHLISSCLLALHTSRPSTYYLLGVNSRTSKPPYASQNQSLTATMQNFFVNILADYINKKYSLTPKMKSTESSKRKRSTSPKVKTSTQPESRRNHSRHSAASGTDSVKPSRPRISETRQRTLTSDSQSSQSSSTSSNSSTSNMRHTRAMASEHRSRPSDRVKVPKNQHKNPSNTGSHQTLGSAVLPVSAPSRTLRSSSNSSSLHSRSSIEAAHHQSTRHRIQIV